MDVAIIPARAGSKRIKNKNIKLFNNKHLIYYSIKAAIKSNLFKRVIVSTDSKKISNIAKKYGAEVPFLRPKSLSDDYTSTQKVINHAIDQLKNKDLIRNVCCIYATAPFIDYKDLIKANKILKKDKNTFVFTAAKFHSSAFRSFYFKKKKLVKAFPKFMSSRSQDLKDTYFDVGQFYYANKKKWLKGDIFSEKSKIIQIPYLKSYDLNNIEDWKVLNKIKKIKNL